MERRVDSEEEWRGEDFIGAVCLAYTFLFFILFYFFAVFVVDELPLCSWFLLFLQCRCNVYFQLRERTQSS